MIGGCGQWVGLLVVINYRLSSDIAVLNKGTGISSAAAKSFKDNVTKVKREKNEVEF